MPSPIHRPPVAIHRRHAPIHRALDPAPVRWNDGAMPVRRLLALLVLALLLSSCGGEGPVAPAPRAEGMRVLFVGNSLTYFHSIPLIVEAIGVAQGEQLIATESQTLPGYSLGDHLQDGIAEQMIKFGNYEFVVMQQGPSALATSRVILREDVANFADICQRYGSTPAVYQVWPEFDRFDAFPDVIESYRLAAEDVGAPLFAVGSAWLVAWDMDPSLPLYGPDQFHPSALGSYLAALVIYEGLTGRSAVGAPATLILRNHAVITMTGQQAATLQAAAESVRQAP